MTLFVRQDDVRRQNQYGVLTALRRHGPLSRTELSAATGLSASTVTVIVNGLMERGVLSADGPGDPAGSRRGRPQVRLAPSPGHASVAVMMLTHNNIRGALYDYAGGLLGDMRLKTPTHDLDTAGLAGAMTGVLDALLDRSAGVAGPLARIAVGSEGIVDAGGRMLVSSPMIGMGHVAIADALEGRFGVPVVVANDCNMIAEALHWKAPERYGPNFAAVLLSVGIGMGLYLNNRLFSGIHSSATEFGHMNYRPDGALCRCGRRGCIEAYAGAHSIWRAATGRDTGVMLEEDPPENGLEIVAERARRFEGPERQAFREAGKALGTGLSSLFTMFDALPLVFTGPGVAVIDLMMDSIGEVLAKPCFGQPVAVSVVDQEADHMALEKDGCLMSALTFLDANSGDVPEVGARIA